MQGINKRISGISRNKFPFFQRDIVSFLQRFQNGCAGSWRTNATMFIFLSLSLSFNNFLIVGSVTKSATRTSAASKEASVNNGGGVVFFSLTITSFVVSVSPVRILQSSSKAESSLSSDSPSSVVSAPRNASNPLSVVFLARA